METKNITGEIFGVVDQGLGLTCKTQPDVQWKYLRYSDRNDIQLISPFFVAINKRGGEYWYQNKIVGHNTLTSLLGKMGRRANLSGKKTID